MDQTDKTLIKQLRARGLVAQTSADASLERHLDDCIVAYCGFDPTAESLHIGHLVPLLVLKRFQMAGHKPVAVIGGATGMIGDPSFKARERRLLSENQILEWGEKIKNQISRFVDVEGVENAGIILNNLEWVKTLGALEFLRDIGKYFSVNNMIKAEAARIRLERNQGYSFIEFNYRLMQAYDFLHLYRKYGVTLQVGGSDQWGNIVGGVDLVHKADGGDAYGLTAHLITTASGGKMGKTADGAVWLNADRKSPYEYWQFWRNTEDADVGRFLALFTELSMDEVNRLAALQGAEINEAKIILANEATILCHGADAAREAMQTAQQTFVSGGGVSDGLPQTEIHADEANGMEMITALNKVGFATSNGEARRLIRGGGARLNDAQINDEAKTLSPDDFVDGKAKISAGKKRHALLVLV